MRDAEQEAQQAYGVVNTKGGSLLNSMKTQAYPRVGARRYWGMGAESFLKRRRVDILHLSNIDAGTLGKSPSKRQGLGGRHKRKQAGPRDRVVAGMTRFI